MADETPAVSLPPVTITAEPLVLSDIGGLSPQGIQLIQRLGQQYRATLPPSTATIAGGGATSVPPGSTESGPDPGWTGEWPTMNGDEGAFYDFGGGNMPGTDVALADPTALIGQGGYGIDDYTGTSNIQVDQGEGLNWPSMADFMKKLTSPIAGGPASGGAGFPLSRAAGRPMFQPNQPMIPPGVSSNVGLMQTVRAILAYASSRVGSRLSLANVIGLVRYVGPAAAALALGLTIAEIYTLLTANTIKRGRRRRGRGITARQITTARRTIRKMTTFMGMVQSACAPVSGGGYRRRRAHRAGCGCPVCRRAA